MDSWEMDNTNITTSSLATTTTEPTQDAWRGTFPIISGVVMWACIILCAILCRRVCIECSDCFKRIFFKTRLFLAHTWPCSRCVDEPTPDDVSVASDVTIHDEPPEYSIALNMPKPERDADSCDANQRRSRRGGRRNSVDVIAMTDVNQASPRRSSLTPPPAYSNQGFEVFDDFEPGTAALSNRTSHDVSVQIETDQTSDVTTSSSATSTPRNCDATAPQTQEQDDLPSYEAAIRSLFLARRYQVNSCDAIPEQDEQRQAELPV